MLKYKKFLSLFAAIFLSSELFAEASLDDDLQDLLDMRSELKADVGSRSGAKNFLESRSPVDVITHTQIEDSGLTSLTDVMRYFVAGFNAPETSVADGSDHVRAFTLRGMSPDQVLVLVNGKRVHTSALLHVNGTIGRGSSGVDLDTIALVAIDKIEILRDGAAAQYGSDAISGVINIILKGFGHQNEISSHIGIRDKGDGKGLEAGGFVSIPLEYDGFLNLSLSAKDEEQTQRAGKDRRLSPASVKTHAGRPDAKNLNLVLNAESFSVDDLTLYSNALFNYRESEASAFFRPHDANTSAIYSNGFLPIIEAEILDYSFVLGAKGKYKDTEWDLSNTYGYNEIGYKLRNSMNYGYAASSPTSFNLGELSFMQNTTNLDLKHMFDKFELAFGGEYRYENYVVKKGDASSYTNGISQGFAGYRPENEVDASRSNYALYVDGIYSPIESLSLEGATRYENYSDFGQTLNAKLSMGYKAIETLLFRSSISTGFRAPSLAQSNYSHTSTFGGKMEGTFRPEQEISKALGAKKLKAEKSKHLTIGGVYQPTSATYFMLDYFYTQVKDRIMLSNEIGGSTASPTQQAILNTYGVDKARFFTNAVDTVTQGIDAKLTHRFDFEGNSKLHSSLWYNYSINKVDSFNDSGMNRINSKEQIDRIENGQPKHSLRLLNKYEIQKTTITLNLSGYGSYSQVIDNQKYTFKESWTADLDLAYAFTKKFKVAIGGHNIFDAYPEKFSQPINNFYGRDAIKPYSRYSPFGYSGAYYYARATLKF
ncbi:MAG: TonB-dependent receptor [Sulfurimonas sp.]|uniref:TonB-dependent receptor plug domain-containing protein n=1 Tax=Sulfurimonas sp. TaxID=2022749 RepID=UPI0025E23500|nr:TonB-dependent receptor [Sulfurimonas sp.]MCK9492264.1 TonB-dependent receptor [Sulfurimonas sp.]